ncbi:hypothetical protein AAY473_023545 [Plecturocebus cupreus]
MGLRDSCHPPWVEEEDMAWIKELFSALSPAREYAAGFPIPDQTAGACSGYANIGNLPIMRHQGKPSTKHIANYMLARLNLAIRMKTLQTIKRLETGQGNYYPRNVWEMGIITSLSKRLLLPLEQKWVCRAEDPNEEKPSIHIRSHGNSALQRAWRPLELHMWQVRRGRRSVYQQPERHRDKLQDGIALCLLVQGVQSNVTPLANGVLPFLPNLDECRWNITQGILPIGSDVVQSSLVDTCMQPSGNLLWEGPRMLLVLPSVNAALTFPHPSPLLSDF